MRFLKKLAASIVLIAQLASAGNAVAQAMPATIFNPTSQPNGGWSYDPAVSGMRDLRELLPIEGCNAPGGLYRITDRDEANSAPFWCGVPPDCLAEGTAGVDACVFVPFCRREPRYDPNGISGGNGCRDPEDLLCVSSGAHPVGGKCLQTCWDGSKILFSETCPVQTKTCPDGSVILLAATCPTTPPTTKTCPDGTVIPVTGTCPATPPATKTCPDGSPIPATGTCPSTPPVTKQSCSAGSAPYETCNFTWAATAHGSSISVASDNGVSGTLSSTCNDGLWINSVATCTTPTTTPASCAGGSAPYETCNFAWDATAHGSSISVVSDNGVSGTLSSTCDNGLWINSSATCTPAASPTVCLDGTPVPANGVCPQAKEYCPDGVTVMPKNRVCPVPTKICIDELGGSFEIPISQTCPTITPPTQTCSDGSVILASATCTQTCPDGSVIPASAACTQTCPDGSVIPASAACTPPPPVMQTCPGGSIIPASATCTPPPPPSPPAFCTSGYYALTAGYDYCDKKPEFATTYQVDFSWAMLSSVMPPPPLSQPEKAFGVLNINWMSCNGDAASGPPSGAMINVMDTQNAMSRSQFCLP